MIPRSTCHTALVVMLCACLDAAGGDNTSSGKGEAEVTADQLQVDHSTRTAVFEGHVHAKLDRLSLRCGAMTLTYDDQGEIKSLSASGGVTLVREDLRAASENASLDAKSGRLVLSGNPTVTKGPHQLTGEVIEVDLDSGKLVVKEARGTFRLKKGNP